MQAMIAVTAKVAGGRVTDTHRIVFTPSGKRGDFADGTSVLEAARQLGVDVDSVCGGRGFNTTTFTTDSGTILPNMAFNRRKAI